MDMFKLLGTIAVDNSGANEALENTGKKGQDTESKLSKAFTSVGKGAVAVGKTVATGIAVGGAAMSVLTVKALSLSGQLEQNMGGSEAVFKEYATKMQDTAKTAFSNMGLSTSDFLATANKMGALFQGAGFDIQQSSDLSASAMQRAADVASIMGIDTASAMDAVAGAAKGNFTMMDNLGVAMNETTLANYALEKGMEKTYDQMTQQEKIGVSMEMFLDKTTYAAGNYAKENETLAGSLGTAKSALTNFLDGSGDVESLVGSFSNLADVVIRSLEELAPRLVSGITDITNQVMPQLPSLMQKLLPVIIDGAVALVDGLVIAMPGVISALTDSLPALIAGIQKIINALIQALPKIIEGLVSALPTLLPMLIDGLLGMIILLCTNFSQIIQPIIDYLPEIIISIVNALLKNLPALIKGFIQLVIGLVVALPQILSALATGLIEALKAIFQSVKTLISNAWNEIGKVPALAGVKDAIEKVFVGIKNTISGAVNAIKTAVTTVFNAVKDAMYKPIEHASNAIKGIIDKIKGFFGGLKLTFPNIKLPHFGLRPSGWKIGDLLKGSIPKLSIDWYAKAMDNPIMMSKPTIWGYDTESGNLKGGGEAGTEVVSGATTLMNMIQSAVALQNESLSYYMQRIIEILSAYFPQVIDSLDMDVVLDDGLLVGRLAPAMDLELGKIKGRKDRGR